ncbi:Transcription factor TFIIIB component B [Tritrichomonas musculus]|uniref:Transcription factor TFIIIB component B n=1 Tax=Tritrichomonas musculus TaxID=1915356 RepID=A0ABR2JSF2_9EUKA
MSLDNIEMPLRPRPGFRPISRTNSVVNRDRQVETQTRNELETIPLAELIKKNGFGMKATNKKHEKDDENNEDNDEVVGDTNFEDAGEAADFVNVFKVYDEDTLREEGFENTNQYLKAEFNEEPPKRFGDKTRKSTPRWKPEETDFFYHVLSMCGTDFSMMSKFFTNRNRRMIVNKFHIEEQNNPERVKECLEHQEPLDLSLYATTVGIDEGSIVEDYKKNKSKLIQPLNNLVIQPRKFINSNSDSEKNNSSDELSDATEDEEPDHNSHITAQDSDENNDSDEIEGDLNF